MTDWKTKLKDAKEMLDMGLIEQAEYDELKAEALAAMREKPSASNPKTPNQIGAYALLGPIGKGGMGQVYRGRHSNPTIAERQGGEVAVKRLHAHYAQDPDFRARFQREASLGLKLNHPGIVKVFDLVQDGGELALVMELAEGRPLSELIGDEVGPIPWEKAWPLFEKILAAVDCAHSQGVVHRDIKPENIIVSDSSEIKILDFGIAKDLSQGKTKTGTGMGTVDYMAPEQYTDAKRVDQRADIYALGMTLYEMLAGRLPWDKHCSEFDILTVKNHGNLPPPTDYYPHIPPRVVTEIFRATSRELRNRHDSVLILGKALMKAGKPMQETPARTIEPPKASPTLNAAVDKAPPETVWTESRSSKKSDNTEVEASATKIEPTKDPAIWKGADDKVNPISEWIKEGVISAMFAMSFGVIHWIFLFNSNDGTDIEHWISVFNTNSLTDMKISSLSEGIWILKPLWVYGPMIFIQLIDFIFGSESKGVPILVFGLYCFHFTTVIINYIALSLLF